MTATTPPTEDDISLCKSCFCMTHTINDKCGKCGADKATEDELSKVVGDLRHNIITKCIPIVVNGGGSTKAAKLSDVFEAKAKAALKQIIAKAELRAQIKELDLWRTYVASSANSERFVEELDRRTAALESQLQALEKDKEEV